MLAGKPALVGYPGGSGEQPVGQACAVVVRLQHELIASLVRKYVLAELGSERRKPLDDLRQARLLVGAEARAGSDEAPVRQIEDAALLGVERQRRSCRQEGIDAREQGAVHADVAVVLGGNRRNLALDGLEFGVGVRACEIPEHAADPRQPFTGEFERVDRVGEGRWLRVAGDRRDLRPVAGEGDIEGGPEMLRLDPVERRQAKGRFPFGEERVGLGDRVHRHLSAASI